MLAPGQEYYMDSNRASHPAPTFAQNSSANFAKFYFKVSRSGQETTLHVVAAILRTLRDPCTPPVYSSVTINNNNVPFLYSAYHIQMASLCARGIITPALALMQPFSAKSIRRN